MEFIAKIHTLFALLEGKNLATTRPPEEIDSALEMVLQDLFNKYFDHYVKTKKIDAYLSPFKRTVELTLVSGVKVLPGDYAHYREAYLSDGVTKVDIIADAYWNSRVNRKLGAPTAAQPIARIEMIGSSPVLSIKVHPAPADSKVILEYFKTVATPRYGYSIEGNRYVYDANTTVDVEFPPGLYPDITNRLLQMFGITLREGQLVQMMEQAKITEQAK